MKNIRKQIQHVFLLFVSRILLLILVVATTLSITGCSNPVEKEDVVGTYVKISEQPVKFFTSNTKIDLKGTEGEVILKLREDGLALLGEQELPWTLDEGNVIIYLFNASASGEFKGDKIVDLGGKGIIWKKK